MGDFKMTRIFQNVHFQNKKTRQKQKFSKLAIFAQISILFLRAYLFDHFSFWPKFKIFSNFFQIDVFSLCGGDVQVVKISLLPVIPYVITLCCLARFRKRRVSEPGSDDKKGVRFVLFHSRAEGLRRGALVLPVAPRNCHSAHEGL